MAVKKLSDITASPSDFASGDSLVGVRTGPLDLLFGFSQIGAGLLSGVSSDTQVLFNDGGAIAGNAGLTFDKTAQALTVGETLIFPTNDATPTLTSIKWTAAGDRGIYSDSGSSIRFAYNHLLKFILWSDSTFQLVDNAGSLGWADALICRDAAGILAQRNGTNAQTLRVYNTYTDATTGEWFGIDWQMTANVATIGTFKGSVGGSARDLAFYATGYKLKIDATSGDETIISGAVMAWSSSSSDARTAGDSGLARNAAGVIEVNNGTAGTFRDIIARNIEGAGSVSINNFPTLSASIPAGYSEIICCHLTLAADVGISLGADAGLRIA